MFWNNICEWLQAWYGISAVNDCYSGFDCVEANGRVFVKVKASTLPDLDIRGSLQFPDSTINDHIIGFVKPTSEKITILDVVESGNSIMTDHTTLSARKDEVTWIRRFSDNKDKTVIDTITASARISDGYALKKRDVVIGSEIIGNRKPMMVLFPYHHESFEDAFVFAGTCNAATTDMVLLSVSFKGECRQICRYDKLYGYNEKTIFLAEGNKVVIVDRSTGAVRIMDDTETSSLAFVDAARDEFFFYEKREAKHPGESALIGLRYDIKGDGTIVSKERIACPDVVSDEDNPLIFDGYKYVWRLNSLHKGFKVFRKDASLREQFIVDRKDESANSPIVFTSPTITFVEWESTSDTKTGRRLSYSTNKGLCQMFKIDK